MVLRCITRNKCKWITLALLITLFAFAYIGRTGVSIIKTIVLYSSPENGLEIVDQFLQRPNGSMGLIRMLRPLGCENTIITCVSVVLPERYSDSIDTRKLKIDHHKVLPTYLQFVISAFYAFGVINEDEIKTSDILSIGLGGGAVNSYFSYATRTVYTTVVEINPLIVELAQQYFGFEQDHRQKYIIQDGAVYIHNAAKRAESFHGLFIDACGTKKGFTKCPVVEFMNNSTLELYPKILHSAGVFMMNFLEQDTGDPINHLDNVLLSVGKVFEGCRAHDVPNYLNSVIICVKQSEQLVYLMSDEFDEKVAYFQAELWQE